MEKRIGAFRNADRELITLKEFFKVMFEESVSHYGVLEHCNPEEMDGFTDRIFGLPKNSIEVSPTGEFFLDKENRELAENNFKKKDIWLQCSELYEYAINGTKGSSSWYELIEKINIYMQMINSDFSPIFDDARILIDLGTLRFGIDQKLDHHTFRSEFDPFQIIALIAKLDERTVKNADSMGMFNGDAGHLDYQAIHAWLRTKRGFVPTKGLNDEQYLELSKITTSEQFGNFLKDKRTTLGKIFNVKTFSTSHFLFTKKTIDELESGQFNLPINVIPTIAGAYVLDERQLLNCVMKIFFPSELDMIKGESNE